MARRKSNKKVKQMIESVTGGEFVNAPDCKTIKRRNPLDAFT